LWLSLFLEEAIGDTLNDFDEILAEHFSPEAAQGGSRNSNQDSLDFENSEDLNHIIEKYESMLRLEPAAKSLKTEVKSQTESALTESMEEQIEIEKELQNFDDRTFQFDDHQEIAEDLDLDLVE